MGTDTIAAIATAMTSSGIGIVRISGDEAVSITDRIFEMKNQKKLEDMPTHTIHYGHIHDGDEVIDEVMVVLMREPKSYTREDTVEIDCHGGVYVMKRILETVIKYGARPAEPGEFTKRAFLNGRIDLTQAESVMDLINGKSEQARKVAMRGVDGEVGNLIRMLRQQMLELLAAIEVNIDYPEYEDAEDMTTNKIAPVLKSIQEKLHHIIEQSENGAILKNGIQTVIVGRPNVGKSSILNRLLKQDKAIVTDIAGTTRDLVEGSITISGVALDIIDTAGIRDTDNVVEKIGVDKSLSLIPKADLVIAVFNCNEVFNEEDKELLKKIDAHKSIIVLNKNDLPSKIDESVFEGYAVVHTNTKDVDGIDTLRNKIVELFHLDQLEKNDYTCLSNIRQIRLAKEAYQSILNAVSGAEQLLPPDMIEIDIKDAWSTLGEIIGETYSDELIDQLFSQFCLGK